MTAMMDVDDLLDRLGSGRTSAVEIVETTFARIDERDGLLHAFVELDRERALEAARASDDRRRAGRPLALDGVPVAVKANLAVAGLAWSAGLAVRRDRVAERDAVAVARLRAAGAIVVGTTNLPEGALGAVGANDAFGDVRNPVDPTRSAGGSSSGSAAAVAAGMVPVAIGTDTMGSLRVPASHCGVVAAKPSHGRVDLGGLVLLSHRLDTIGPLASRVTGVALVADVLAGLLPRPLADVPATDLRLTVPTEIDTVALDPVVRDAFEATCAALVAGGMTVRRAPLNLDLRRVRLDALLEVVAGAWATHEDDLTTSPSDFSDGFRRLVEHGRVRPAFHLARAQRRLDAVASTLTGALGDDDAFLLPTVPHPAPRVLDGEPDDAGELTTMASAAGWPAVSLPMPDAGMLPVGVQLVAPRDQDHRLLAIARTVGGILGTA